MKTDGMQRRVKPTVADMSSKMDQVSGTEKLLALYPTINGLNMGKLVVSKNQSTRWVKLGLG